MKTRNWMAFSILAFAGVLSFQNCSPGDFSGVQQKSGSVLASSQVASQASSAGSLSALSSSAPSSSASSGTAANSIQVLASGNSLKSSSGKTLNFVNLQGLSIGSASITGTQSSFTVSLYNAPSGRKASVRVYVDTAGNFLRVTADSTQPYMCHDQSAPICAQFANLTSGQMESNCQSPILFNGSISGSVNNLTTAASDICGSSSSAPSSTAASSSTNNSSLCTISYSGGGAMQTANISQDSCMAACQNNQSLNPSEKLTCLYNGQVISTPARTASSSSCGGTLSSGSVVNTISDTSGQSNYAGLQCGQANGTALQCQSCSAKWNYPRGSSIGALIQCVCN